MILSSKHWLYMYLCVCSSLMLLKCLLSDVMRSLMQPFFCIPSYANAWPHTDPTASNSASVI